MIITWKMFSRIINLLKVNSKRKIKNIFLYVQNFVNCGLCKHLIEGKSFTFKCRRTIQTTHNIFCDVKNIICIISSCGCSGEYIGKMGDLQRRVTLHNQQRRDINTSILGCCMWVPTLISYCSWRLLQWCQIIQYFHSSKWYPTELLEGNRKNNFSNEY